MKANLLELFADRLLPGSTFALMPISRLLIETPFRLDGFHFMPAGSIDLTSLKIEPPANIASYWDEETGVASLEGESLRRCASSITGATTEVFETSASVAFVLGDTLASRSRNTHQDDVQLLSLLSQAAERALDWIRFDFCRFDLPATLPGVAGTWTDSGTFVCAIVYDPSRDASELIAGEAILHSVVSKGLGLELDEAQCAMVDGVSLPSAHDGEVGGIAQHGLRLFSDVMNANTTTFKFLRAMTLLEFLAAPFEFQRFQDSKKDIIVHIAGTHGQYTQLLYRFHELSDLKNPSTGNQEGFRTLMVHHGRFLEELLPALDLQAELFRELQRYTGKVLDDFVRARNSRWSEIKDFRKKHRQQLLRTDK